MFSGINIAVIGDLMIDEYIYGSCNRISPEAPVQVVQVNKSQYKLGGCGNVINNILSLGGEVGLYSVVGDDKEAKEIKSILEGKKLIKLLLLQEQNRVTTKKSRVIASNHQIVRLDNETCKDITQNSQNAILNQLQADITNYNAIILSDYAKGVLTPTLTKEIIALANNYNIPILIDPKGKDFGKYKGATLITPNKNEAAIALNLDISKENLYSALQTLKEQYNIKYPLITLSEEGIGLLEDSVKIIPTVAKEVYDVTGAGDTVIAALALNLAKNINIKSACEFANKAAAVVVGKLGSATATIEEILEYKTTNSLKIEDKIKTKSQIETIVANLKKANKKIVFTNGCFDILHRGHASYLQSAKDLGDILIVGLNSDESIKRLKGNSRPINSFEDRAYLLAALQSIDFVVGFEEDTPYNLIKAIVPDILVKGADYKNKEVVGSDIAKEVKLIEFIDGKSTSLIIEKIKG